MLKDFISIEGASIEELYDIMNETDDSELIELIEEILYEREQYTYVNIDIEKLIGEDYL